MKIYKEKFKTDRNNKLYWGRVHFISDDRGAKTKLFWAMSFEYVRRQLLQETWKDEDVDHLLNKEVVNRVKETKRKIFNRPVKFSVNGIDQKEDTELMLYLEERDKIDRHG
ncbi:MAG: hypothetical protein WCX69_01025 [Candidatus Paceibacterota bacterium]